MAFVVGAIVIGIGLMFEMGDWSGVLPNFGFGGAIIAAFGAVLGVIGRSVFRGSPMPGLQVRATSIVIVLLMLPLSFLGALCAVLVLKDNAHSYASPT